MGKLIVRFSFYLLTFSLPKLMGQTLQVTVSPTACASQTILASVTTTVNGALIHFWSISPPELIIPGATANNTQVSITFTACGNHTLTCNAFNSISQIASTSRTLNVICPGVVIVPLTQTVCVGNGATLTASGANSYTWSNQLNSAIINPTVLTTSIFSVSGNVNNCSGTATVQVVNLSINPSSTLACLGNSVSLFASGANNYTWTGSSLSNSVLQPSISCGPGTYTVSSQSSSVACTSSVNILLAPPINLSLSQSDFTTCIVNNSTKKSKPISLFASVSGSVSFNWLPLNASIPNSPTVIVTPSVNTCYTVVAAAIGMVCTESAVVCLSVVPQFTFTVVSSSLMNGLYQNTPMLCRYTPGSVNITNISTLAVGPPTAFSYSWSVLQVFSFSSLVTPTVNLIPQNTFTYSVEITDTLGCISSPIKGTVYVAICESGIKTLENENKLFEIFPNPTKDLLSIRPRSEIQNPRFELVDLVGKVILLDTAERMSNIRFYDFNLIMLQPGIYLLRIFSDGQILGQEKFVKE